MPSNRRTLVVSGEHDDHCVVCFRCRLRLVHDGESDAPVLDLLLSHWSHDHHLPAFHDAAASARDRLTREHPDLLEKLESQSNTMVPGYSGARGHAG